MADMRNFTFTSRTVPECEQYLQLAYQGRQFLLDEFSAAYKTQPYQLEQLLPDCSIIYRGTTMTFDEYRASRIAISDQLKLSRQYSESVISLEPMLAISNFDYYKSAKFLEKAEACLQSARIYLMRGANIIDLDCNVPWKYGYLPIFDLRTVNLTTAIIWYNNCFDHILQIAFLAFELYRDLKDFKPDMAFEDILRLCSYKNFTKIHNKRSNDTNFSELWTIIEDCHKALSSINIWANYAKHKGGIGYIGLKPECPYQIFVGSPDGKVEARTSEFESVQLDADQCIPELIAGHQAICNCIAALVDFIEYPKANYRIDENGRFDIPEKSTYVKIQARS